MISVMDNKQLIKLIDDGDIFITIINDDFMKLSPLINIALNNGYKLQSGSYVIDGNFSYGQLIYRDYRSDSCSNNKKYFCQNVIKQTSRDSI